MKLIKTVLVLTSMFLVSQAMPVNAQSMNDCTLEARVGTNSLAQLTELGRALNLARQTGEATNGGLRNYRAEPSMFGPVSETDCIVSGDDLWTFTFKGTEPGSSIPMVETAVTINHQTWEITVDRNTRLY
jgi:hypothetical protein